MVNLDNYLAIKAEAEASNAQLISVSKTKPEPDIISLYEQGCKVFGENKAQELETKAETLPKDIQWHMIGHLQRNKVKYMAAYVYMIHGVDSLRLAEEIDKQASIYNRTIKILLQVHIAQEDAKFGFAADELKTLAMAGDIQKLKHLEVCGLMGMATNTNDQDQIRKEFQSLKDLHSELAPQFGTNWKEISMGMSGDYKIALECGSTLIRVGSRIFGTRE